jgi:hypothetical protein
VSDLREIGFVLVVFANPLPLNNLSGLIGFHRHTNRIDERIGIDRLLEKAESPHWIKPFRERRGTDVLA